MTKKWLSIILLAMAIQLYAQSPGDVIITEIMYNPNSSEAAPNDVEWIEIANCSANSIDITGWVFQDEDGAGSPFPAFTLNSGDVIVIVSNNTAADFQAAWGTGITVIGLSGNIVGTGLANDPSATNEILTLRTGVNGTIIDEVNYDDGAPWPVDNESASIYLVDGSFNATDNDNGSNWALSAVGVAGAFQNTVTSDFGGTDVGSPGVAQGIDDEVRRPEMDVKGGGSLVSIPDGDTSPSAADGTDFGPTDIATGTVDHTFTIENTGTADLNLTGTPKVMISGANAGDFTVILQPSSPVASGGGTTTFIIRFDPSAAGLRTATVSIANNDADKNPYDFAIQGIGTIPPPHSFVLLADEDVEISRNVDSEGDIHANDDIVFKRGNRPQSKHTGNLTAVDDIEVKTRNEIDGMAEAGDEVDNDGTITGGFTENGGVAVVSLPTIPSFTAGDEDIEVDEGETRVLGFGDYGEAEVEEEGILQLSAGTYNLEQLEMGKESVLEIDVSGGAVTINIEDELKIGKSVTMVLNGSTTLVTFNIAGDEKIVIDSGSLWFGNIIAPEGTVELGSKARFQGAICAENIKVKKNARFVSQSFAGPFPKTVVPLSELDDDDDDAVDDEITAVPTEYALEQNYPNPFSASGTFGNPSTEISFQLPVASEVKLVIYSLTGQVVRELAHGEMPGGRHTITWNGRNRAGETVAGGVYLYRLTVERGNGGAPVVITKKMTLLK